MNSPLAFFDSPFSVPESALSPTLADLANDIFGFDNFATAYVDYSEPFGQMSGPSTSFLPSDILSFATGHSDPTAQDLYSSEMSQYDDNQSWTPEGLSPFGPIMSSSWEHLVSAPSPASSHSSMDAYNALENSAACRTSLSSPAQSRSATPAFSVAHEYSSPSQSPARQSRSRSLVFPAYGSGASDSYSETDDEESSGCSGSEYTPSDDDETPLRSRPSATHRLSSKTTDSRSARRQQGPPSSGPQRVPRKTRTNRARQTPYAAPTSTPSSSSSSASGSSRLPPLRISKSRLTKVSAESSYELEKDGPCPVCKKTLKWSDLKRHFMCHLNDIKYVCCGVPIEKAEMFGVEVDMENAYEWNGVLRVGGCWRVLSRRDALLRHLKDTKTNCVCDV